MEQLHALKLTLLKGSTDQSCNLSRLFEDKDVAKKIFDDMQDEIKQFEEMLTHSEEAFMPYHAFDRCGDFEFPRPKDINVNMMPISIPLDLATLPDYLHDYKYIIADCVRPQWIINHATEYMNKSHEYVSKVAYLTIHEGWVEAGQSQRRPGVHIESPLVSCKKTSDIQDQEILQALAWGMGCWCGGDRGIPYQGIFVAHNIPESSKAWRCIVSKPELVCDKMGGIKDPWCLMGDGEYLEPNTLYWMTDKTPHESCPVKEKVYRQFFRLVVGPIGVWYSKHNTPNPFGVQPDAPISHEDKFEHKFNSVE